MAFVHFLEKIGIYVPRNTCKDKDFDYEIKIVDKDIAKLQKRNVDEELIQQVENRKLLIAFAHKSIKSAFWWLEHLADNAVTFRHLHVKFKHSLEDESGVYDKKIVSREQQERFVAMTLRNDVDYVKLGFDDKTDCCNSIMSNYYKLLAHSNIYIREHASPYLTVSFWKYLKNEKTENKTMETLIEEYNCWLTDYIKLFKNKYSSSYHYISVFDYDKI